MRSAWLLLALTSWTALATPTPHGSLLKREDAPRREYVCSNSTDKADRPRSCQGLVAKIKDLRTKHTSRGVPSDAGITDRRLCDGQCCLSWSPGGEALGFGQLFTHYNLIRKASKCPTNKPVKWIDETKGLALCLSGKGDECDFADPLARYVDDDDCPEGCYFDIVVDEEAVDVDAIGGSGRGSSNPIEKKATAWDAEQLAAQGLDKCAEEGGCKDKTITDGVTWLYACGKNVGAQCHVLPTWKDGAGPRTIRVSTYWEVEPAGLAARGKMVEVMKAALRQTVMKDSDRKVRLNDEDWAGITYQKVPKNYQVSIRGIPQEGKNSRGVVAKLVMGFASCNDSPLPWSCGKSVGKIAVDTALRFMGPIGRIAGLANTIGCATLKAPPGRIDCEEGQAYNIKK